MSAIQKVLSVAATVAGGVGGAMAGGPVGLGIGAALGAGVDYLRAKAKASAAPALGAAATSVVVGPGGAVAVPPIVAAAMTPGGLTLPASADRAAAASAGRLLKVAATQNWNHAEMAPAVSWIKQFQTSVRLPPTGNLDPQTRALLALADPVNGPTIPAGSPIG